MSDSTQESTRGLSGESPSAPTALPPAVDALRAALDGAILEVIQDRGETTVVVAREAILDALRLLRDEPSLRYSHCSDVTAVDYLDLGIEPRFCVVYHLYSFQNNHRLRLRAPVPEDDPQIDSCAALYPTANWHEREVFDLFGIGFRGHPDLKRILLPDDWDGPPPLRKDSPIGGEDVEFRYNVGRVHGRRSEI